MAKIEPWEQRVRDGMAQFAKDLNRAFGLALAMQDIAHNKDPEHVPSVDLGNAKTFTRLVEPARIHLVVSEAIKKVIAAQEDEDAESIHKAMKPVVEFTEGIKVELQWIYGPEGYRINRNYEPEDDAKQPFVTAVLVFALGEYLSRYQDLVHLGVCRQCGTAYLKPKHGRKQRYCSRACQQKAYRVRRAEKEEQGD